MAVVVEPIVTKEKTLALLAEGYEQSALDYKRKLDLSERHDEVELAKDVGAMQAEEHGGYIVVGADDNGGLSGMLTDDQAKLFDEATVRAKLKKFIAEPFDIQCATYVIDEKNVAIVYIAPSPRGWCIFTNNGDYRDSNNSSRTITTFRVGDVFVRKGTASTRWQAADLERLLNQVMNRRKESWRAEFRSDLAATVQAGTDAQQLAQLPASALSWKLDEAGFDELVTEMLRRADYIPVIRMISQARADAGELPGNFDELCTLLDRLTSLGALALQYDQHEWLDRVVDALVGIYEYGFDGSGLDRQDIDAPQLWLHVMERVYALGGLAVRLKQWKSVRLLADRRPHGHGFEWFGSWLRHALTMAWRGQKFAAPKDAGLLGRAQNVVRTLDALHLDVSAESEAVLSSLCQFDVYGALVVVGEQNDADDRNWYTNFARYYPQRSLPAFVTMVTDQQVRQTLFDGDDELMAHAIRDMYEVARKEAFRFDGWYPLPNADVDGFVERNLPPV